MSLQKFDDACPGCRPVLMDMQTGEVLPVSHPAMLRMIALWAAMTPGEREAFHRVTCHNSRDPLDVALMSILAARFQSQLNR